MTEDTVIQNSFVESLAKTIRKLNFTVLVYSDETKETASLQKGEISAADLPDSILPYILDEKMHCNYFSRGDDMMVIYFIRFRHNKQKYVVVVQDNKQRTRLNRFVSALLNAIGSGGDSDIDTAEKDGIIAFMETQISDLKENLQKSTEEFVKELEKLKENALFDAALWEHEKNDLNDQINKLKTGTDENGDLIKLWEDAAEEDLHSLKQSVAQMHEMEEKLTKAHNDAASLQKELDDFKEENSRLSAELSAQKTKENVASLDDNSKANMLLSLQMKFQELETANNDLKTDLKRFTDKKEGPSEEEPQKLAKLNEENQELSNENQALKKELEQQKSASCDAGKKQAETIEELTGKSEELNKLHAEITALTGKLEEYESENRALQDRLRKKEKSLEDLIQRSTEGNKENNNLAETNQILRKSRDKLTELLNGISQPIFTINNEDKIVTVNKALLAFRGLGKTSDVVGHFCYEGVYKKEARCPWCMIEQVRQNEEPMQISVIANDDTTERNIDITFFPIFDTDGTLIEVAEYITDKTELFEISASLNKFKDKMKDFKKTRLDDMTELNDVKLAYHEISFEHERVMDRNAKMLKVIERLVSEDKARELLAARTELVELRNKLVRSAEMIKNYKYQLDEQLIKYSNLNRRTFLQMERLLNIIKGKTSLKNDEITTVLTFLTREFEFVRKHFIDEQKRAESKTNREPGQTGATQKSFKSVEEKLLKEKLSAKIGYTSEDDDE